MKQNHSGSTKVTRRALLGGAAAGTVALAAGDASAQRCPATPPVRAKGPAVWLDYDQQDIDEMYDQSVFAFNQRHLLARSDANNALATAVIGKAERFAYGSDPIEGVDVWKTRKPDAPVLIYLHGGSWQSGRSADFALYAEPYINAGAHFVSVDFTNVRATKGDLFPLVDQCRRAVAWTYRNAAKFGGDPERLYLCSRSSGSHLAGCVVTTDWETIGLPRTMLKGAVMGSGMYDLKAVRLSARSKFVTFTDEMEQQLSAQRHIDKLHTPLVLCIGTLETPEFQRQSRDFAAAVKAAGKPVELVVGQDYNHFEVGDTIGHPYQLMGRELMKTMKLSVT
jgi:arylformamidase